MSEQRLRVNTENVVYEEVDGEVIAIDLGGGSYYSLAGSAPAVWGLLASGATEAEICTALGERYEADAETLGAEVSALLGKLVEHGLLVAAERAPDVRPSLANGDGSGPFEAPRFERYDDMQDYFLLDPIHEVDTAGWPRPAA
ncbi:MAG TPA: PqqD family protein [Solirubrobacterales bacterium]